MSARWLRIYSNSALKTNFCDECGALLDLPSHGNIIICVMCKHELDLAGWPHAAPYTATQPSLTCFDRVRLKAHRHAEQSTRHSARSCSRREQGRCGESTNRNHHPHHALPSFYLFVCYVEPNGSKGERNLSEMRSRRNVLPNSAASISRRRTDCLLRVLQMSSQRNRSARVFFRITEAFCSEHITNRTQPMRSNQASKRNGST
jgi:hypothetical protein